MQEHTHIYVSDTEVQHSIFHSFYSKLWGLNPPAKCKIFFWRLLNNFLPTFANLQYKRVQVRNTCPLCESAAESTDVFAGWFVNFDVNQQTLLVITYWAICHARNKLIYEGSICSIPTTSTFIQAFILEIESLVEVLALKPIPKKAKWFPPDSNSIKLNFDASFNSSTNSSVTGIVARNSQGLVMAACTFPHSAVADAFTADLGFRSVQVEGDSLSIIKKLNAVTMDRSLIIPIINDIQILRGSFDNITFSFVGWQGNMVAHELAKLGIQFSEPMYWMEEVPMQVERLVLCDLPP
ncbi:hypothetical protein V6N12_066160 [Hibiscus sabdariffa]|uniref:RNase H type-1 domain-containing protein n=1 Tax=Hibiscus sabdariffa TaxID=183260 RepID=A0ABR2B906_9ROSI